MYQSVSMWPHVPVCVYVTSCTSLCLCDLMYQSVSMWPHVPVCFYVTSCTVEPLYNEVLGTMKITLLYLVSHYIRVKKQRNIKSWDQQNYLVIRGFCYIRPRYNEVPLYQSVSMWPHIPVCFYVTSCTSLFLCDLMYQSVSMWPHVPVSMQSPDLSLISMGLWLGLSSES